MKSNNPRFYIRLERFNQGAFFANLHSSQRLRLLAANSCQSPLFYVPFYQVNNHVRYAFDLFVIIV